jgi:hypothetical protein
MNSQDLTAIIPVRIDSPERLRNLNSVVTFLLKFYKCKIIVKEVDSEQKTNLVKDDRLTYIFEQTNDTSFFHRTKILNDMLELVDTKFTINYDCDILIPQDNVKKCLKMLENEYDFVYPYEKESFLTFWEFTEQQLNKILTDPDTSWISYLTDKYPVFTDHPGLNLFTSIGLGKIITTGGIQFFNTDSYKNGFGENEEFIDWGPEDQERLYRFYILGYKIGWIDSGYVVHMNHPKSKASDCNTFYNKENHKLWDVITTNVKSKESMLEYMSSLEYTKKRIIK